MNFVTQFNKKPFDGEVNSGEIIVETAGYVPADRMIKRLCDAGLANAIARSRGQGIYGTDFVEDGEDPVVDPTQDSNFDLADASEAMELLDEVEAKKEAAVHANKAADDEANDEVQKMTEPRAEAKE
jgi:predicted DNA-binding transcriptional regulator YafY